MKSRGRLALIPVVERQVNAAKSSRIVISGEKTSIGKSWKADRRRRGNVVSCGHVAVVYGMSPHSAG